MYVIKYALYTMFFFVFFVISSCSKDDNPTEAEATVEVKLNGWFSSSGDYTPAYIRNVDLLLDGNVIANKSYAMGVNEAVFDVTMNTKKGNHNISFRLNDQYYSSLECTVEYLRLSIGNSTQELENKTDTLATGESITYSVTIE